MEAIRSDMAKTKVPSWISPVPRDWGETRRGKLSADNWHTLYTVHLPITLIRLFGSQAGRRQEIVNNLMDLVIATRIATMQTTSRMQIEQYNRHIFRFSATALQLFPDYHILPSHHAALHIGDMLSLFGPKHSHDSPYYERYIRLFRRMKTNNKLGS
jgi:hypothetical protein